MSGFGGFFFQVCRCVDVFFFFVFLVSDFVGLRCVVSGCWSVVINLVLNLGEYGPPKKERQHHTTEGRDSGAVPQDRERAALPTVSGTTI